jgi:hypothetical protein
MQVAKEVRDGVGESRSMLAKLEARVEAVERGGRPGRNGGGWGVGEMGYADSQATVPQHQHQQQQQENVQVLRNSVQELEFKLKELKGNL